MNQTTPGNSSSETSGGAPATNGLTAELVQQVADKVYQMWRRDLRQENERRREQKPRGGRRYR